MFRRFVIAAVTCVLALAWVGAAGARGGRYVFDGGTARQQAQVRVALQASSFNWNIVPGTVTIHLHKGSDTYATKGEIWVDTALLASGPFAWGPIQHEYAHQVDFFLLSDEQRVQLNALLGGKVWSHDTSTAALRGRDHAMLGAERFASTLAWSYWPSDANSLQPGSKKDESAAMAPVRFRTLLQNMLGVPNPIATVVTVG